QRGDECLLGIDPRRIRPGRGNDVRAGARRNQCAAVEHPFMRAAVLALGEAFGAVAAPADRGGVGAHVSMAWCALRRARQEWKSSRAPAAPPAPARATSATRSCGPPG